jgi:DNA repair exonuclease SbcCD ATPase subunit
MSTFEQARDALEELWEEELQEQAEQREEAEAAVREARERVQRLQGSITDAEQRIAMLSGELEEMPVLLAKADLEEDEPEQARIRGAYHAAKDEIANLRGYLLSAREELHELTGGFSENPEAYLRRVEREHLHPLQVARHEAFKRRQREWNVLRELLEEAFPGGRTPRDRIKAEERAAKGALADAEAKRMANVNSNFAAEQERQHATVLAATIVQNPAMLEDRVNGPGYRATLEKHGLLEEVLQRLKGPSDPNALARHLRQLEDSAAVPGPFSG